MNSAVFFVGVTATLVCPATAFATDAQFPIKPVRMVNPFAAGGGTDVVGLIIGQQLSEAWSQPVVMDNRPGAGTTIGTEIVVRSAPDGYTLLINNGSIATVTALYPRLSFYPPNDLAPVATTVHSPYVLAIHPGVNAKTLPEFTAIARNKSAKLAYSSEGAGSAQFLTMELFKSAAGITLLHVPYKGGSPSIAALAGGEVQATFSRVGNIMPLAKTGKLRPLAVSSPKRIDIEPELPTIAEQGYPGFDARTWYGIFAPAKTPVSVLAKINADVNRALLKPEVTSRFVAMTMFTMTGTREDLRDYLKVELKRWGKVIADTGAKAE